MAKMRGLKIQQDVNIRIKLKDKGIDKIKRAVEELVVAHDGSFTDESAVGSKVKGKYERTVEGKVLRFHYTWHNSMGKNAQNYTRRNLTPHLVKLEIVERLPKFSLTGSAPYDDVLLAYRKRTKIGRAFLAFEDALIDLENEEDNDAVDQYEDYAQALENEEKD